MAGDPGASDDYVSFARDYEWLASDEMLSGDWTSRQYGGVLDLLGPDATILDCSCGIGIDAIALARRGYHVWASDGSEAMVAQARLRAQQANVDLPLRTCLWEELPACYDQRFDLVLCTGNSIVHAAGEARMVTALRGMGAVLKEGGTLVLSSRNWEKLHAERPRVVLPERPTVRGGVWCLPFYIWTVPEAWEASHTAEIVLVFDGGGRLDHRRYEIAATPFRVTELTARIAKAGFTAVETDYTVSADWYTVMARKG